MRWLAIFLGSVVMGAAQQIPSTAQAVPVPFGAGVAAPRLIYKVQPQYTEEARQAKLQGGVALFVVINPDGTASDFRVIKSLGLGLDEEAIETVKRWRFAPGTKAGQPVRVAATIEVNFRLLATPGISGWYLAGIVFKLPEGSTRPILAKPTSETTIPGPQHEPYVPGETGSVDVSFDIDETGAPANVHVDKSSDVKWESYIVSVVQHWKFTPALKDGNPVPARCTTRFVLGDLSLAASTAATARRSSDPPPARSTDSNR